MTTAAVQRDDLDIRPITVEEYLRMAEVGILRHGERVELLDGGIIRMSPTGWIHSRVLSALVEALISRRAEDVRFLSQSTFPLSETTAPEPDLAVFARFLTDRPPLPSECLLLVEVSDSTLDFDLTTKARLYAAAGIPEYWVVDLKHSSIHQMKNPESAEGRYRDRSEYGPGDKVVAQRVPGFAVTLKELLELPKP